MVSSAAMSTAAGCKCTFQDTQFLAGSCGATFALFMGLVEYLVRSKDDIADACNRPGRHTIQVSADGEAPGSPQAGHKLWHKYRVNRVLSTHPHRDLAAATDVMVRLSAQTTHILS